MSDIDWGQFELGDRVSVTIEGTWREGVIAGTLIVEGGFMLGQTGILHAAVEAHKIEPVYKPGDVVRDSQGLLWEMDYGEQWRRFGSDRRYFTTPFNAVRVKVVDA